MSNIIIQGGIYGDENKINIFKTHCYAKNYQNFHLDYCKNKEIPQ
jgi:hypothetical protein